MPRLRSCVLHLACWSVLLLPGTALPADAGPLLQKTPLQPRSGPRGRTMFTEVPPSASGIRTTNDFSDPAMWGALYREFEVGAMGTGVAIGDFDGDGRPDLFVVSKTESCRLFRNLGDFKFEDVTAKAGVGDNADAAKIWKQGATFVDVNNDGRLDLYVCRFNAPNLLYINQGDGTFREMAHAYGLDVVDASVMACFCDYDHDGWLDVFILTNLLDANHHPAGQRDYLFHNERNGTFTNVTDRAGIHGEGQGHSATWWDFDNDGWPDLYVANDFEVPDQLYHNNHDGTFTNVLDQIVPHTPFSSMGADLADVNNDGRVDLFIADMAATTHEKDMRGMAESRHRTVDDQLHPGIAPQYERNVLLLNTGTSRCLEAAQLAGVAATDWTWGPRFEDLDNDGRVDLFVPNGMYREPSNVDLLVRQLSAETMAERTRIMRESPLLAEPNIARRNLGDLRFEDVGAAWGLDQRGVSFGAAFGDLDGDGDLDLVYANYQKGVTVLRNDSDTGHRVIIDLRGTHSNRFGIGSLVRIETASGVQVRPLVLARGYMSSSEPVAHFGLGDDTLLQRVTVLWPDGGRQEFKNLPVDCRLTITEPVPHVVPKASVDIADSDGASTGRAGDSARRLGSSSNRSARSGSPSHRLGDGWSPTPYPPAQTTQFEEVGAQVGLALDSEEDVIDDTALQPLIPVRLNRRGPALASAQLADSGLDALVVGGTTRTPARVLVRSADRYTPIPDALPGRRAVVDDGPVLLFDVDGDGATDLLITKGGSAFPAAAAEYQAELWLGDGRGHFRPAPTDALPALPISAGAAAAADFNCDGTLDLFIGGRVAPGRYPTAPGSALLQNRGGKFIDVTDQIAPGLRTVGMVTAALWSDVDGDGWPDLVLAMEWGTVRYFHNNAGRTFEDWSEKAGFAAAGVGWWTSLQAADFNGDGRMDYVVGNVGLNTPYHADSAHPALLFYGNFAGDDATQIIEATEENGQIVPLRSRRALALAIPSVLRKFPKNNAYASATLPQIVGADKLQEAERFAATELRSGILLSQPDGTYRFRPLPRIAQIAPLQGMVIADFNGDGRLDLYAAQNSYAPIPSVGRYDGGLSQLLLGDGDGEFTAVDVASSGLLVSGDAKAAILSDFGGSAWPGCIVTRNNGSTLAFRNSGAPGGRPLVVRLHGLPGNPLGVGARVSVEYANGATASQEVYAGSGYYAQGPAACWFGSPTANPAKRVRVRWPGGATSVQPIADLATQVTISRE